MRFRPYSPADREQCLELYRLNEPGRFPEGVLEDYNRVLKGTGYILVLEQGGRIIATGGLHHITGRNMTMFWCGLVHPDFQGRGVGTALFFSDRSSKYRSYAPKDLHRCGAGLLWILSTVWVCAHP
jgi:GNAT superfamily N-acetyltransferase